jgi:hypothetical protein
MGWMAARWYEVQMGVREFGDVYQWIQKFSRWGVWWHQLQDGLACLLWIFGGRYSCWDKMLSKHCHQFHPCPTSYGVSRWFW